MKLFKRINVNRGTLLSRSSFFQRVRRAATGRIFPIALPYGSISFTFAANESKTMHSSGTGRFATSTTHGGRQNGRCHAVDFLFLRPHRNYSSRVSVLTVAITSRHSIVGCARPRERPRFQPPATLSPTIVELASNSQRRSSGERITRLRKETSSAFIRLHCKKYSSRCSYLVASFLPT